MGTPKFPISSKTLAATCGILEPGTVMLLLHLRRRGPGLTSPESTPVLTATSASRLHLASLLHYAIRAAIGLLHIRRRSSIRAANRSPSPCPTSALPLSPAPHWICLSGRLHRLPSPLLHPRCLLRCAATSTRRPPCCLSSPPSSTSGRLSPPLATVVPLLRSPHNPPLHPHFSLPLPCCSSHRGPPSSPTRRHSPVLASTSAPPLLRRHLHRHREGGEGRRSSGGGGREQQQVQQAGARAPRGEGPAGVAKRREVPHRLQEAGVTVRHQTGEVPQRVPTSRRAVGEGKPHVAEFPLLRQVSENARQLLSECAASHLRHKGVTSEYGSRLQSSGWRILLQSLPGTELYRERMVRALAHELQVPLLILDSSVLAPYDYGEDYSENEEEEEDEHAESEDEGLDSKMEVEGDEDWTSSNEAKSDKSDEDETLKSAEDLKKSVDDLRKLVPCTIEEFAKMMEPDSCADLGGGVRLADDNELVWDRAAPSDPPSQIWDFNLGKSRDHDENSALEVRFGLKDEGFMIKSYNDMLM